MSLAPTYEQLARLRTLVAQANASRRARTMDLETVLEIGREALSSKLGFAWRHAGDHVDARASTTLCLAVKSSSGLTIGVAGARALDPDPGKAWFELRPWSVRVPAQNVAPSVAWAERDRGDRLGLNVEADRPRRPTSDGSALLEAVLASPDDDRPRLVYADWLTEQGDPRGEFIAVQCARARMPADAPGQRPLEEREWTLMSAHAEQWEAALGKDLTSVKFRRGFIEEATLFTASFVERAEQMFALEPLRTVQVIDAGEEGAANLAASKSLARLDGLRLSNLSGRVEQGIGIDGLGVLLSSRNISRLKSLSLDDQYVGDTGAIALAHAGPAALPVLESLRLVSDSLTALGVEALAGTRWFRRLRRVTLAMNELRKAGAEALAFASGAAAWEELDLDANMLGDDGARALAVHERLGALKRLSLQRNHLGPAGVQALLDSPKLKGLTGLRLDGNRIGGLLTEKLRQRFGAW
jgi:uncharacterized protein (TIGR02996 family)